jgi:TolB-like protein
VAAIIYGVVRWTPIGRPVAEAPSANVQAIRSIAVLPLDNFSGYPNQDYLADGMTDELTTDLATISRLRVISRGSVMQFKGEHRPSTPEIAKLLHVDAVVEGSVLRIGDRVRITAQLIHAPEDKHVWAKSYERVSRDVLALRSCISGWATTSARWIALARPIQRIPSGSFCSRWIASSIRCEKSHASER